MEELTDVKQFVSNYDELNNKQKNKILEKIYRKQIKCSPRNRTLNEIIDRQIKEIERRDLSL